MNENNKTALGVTVSLCAATVASFALMSSCAVNVARVDGERAASCIKANGEWHGGMFTPSGQTDGFCEYPQEGRK